MQHPPDLHLGRTFLQKHLLDGRVLVCAVTGSHFYGFPAPDSDLDLKGIYAAPLQAILGLHPAPESVDMIEQEQGLECDLTLNELSLALKLLVKGNGNMIERVFSPFQLVEGKELHELRGLAHCYLSQRVHHHYKGFFQNVQQMYVKEGKRSLKKMLYLYRIAMTAGHLLQSGEVIGDLTQLAPAYGFTEILPFVEAYSIGSERDVLSTRDDEQLMERLPALEDFMQQSLEKSCLPPEPRDLHGLSDWLVRVRLNAENGSPWEQPGEPG